MRKTRRLLTFCCLMAACCAMAQTDLWKEQGGAPQGDAVLEHKMANPVYYQEAGKKALKVEPFAVYKVTAKVKGNVPINGTGTALVSYGWDSFGWHFWHAVSIGVVNEWRDFSTEICVPVERADFTPLVLSNAKNSTMAIKDLHIVMVQSGADHIKALQAKAELTPVESQLLARYYLNKKDYVNAIKLRETTTDKHARADIACILAKAYTDKDDIRRNTQEMIRNEALRWPDAKLRIPELLSNFTLEEQYNICLWAIVSNPNEYVVRAMDYVGTKGQSLTLAGKTRLLEAKRAALGRVSDKQKENAEVKEAVMKLEKKLEEEEAALAESKANLGKCKITLGGVKLAADTMAVVLPLEPTLPEKHAAEDFVDHIEQMTGISLDIVNDVADGRYPIFIGRNGALRDYGFDVDYAKLGLEGIHMEVNKNGAVLAGGRRGVLYAVYTFLEENLGCRWFTADCIVIPKKGSYSFKTFKKVYVPPLEGRATDYPCSRPLTFSVRNKYNGTYIPDVDEWGGNIHYRGFVHTFNSLVPPSVYGAKHPEYYSEINGRRVVDHSQLCLTNPDVLKIATETVLQWCKESPRAAIISVSQNDWHNYCTCPKCKALAEKEESQMGPLLHFVNAIAREVAKQYPEKIIDTLAYQYTRKPPKFVKPEPNVAIRLCSIECCFVQPLDGCDFNKKFVEDIEGWSKICKRLHIWDYVINYAHTIMPFPNLDVLQPNIQFFIRNGVTGIYEEANYFSTGGELSELRSYLMAKYLWDPNADGKKALYEFTEAYYGAAGEYIRDYLKLLHKTVCSNTKRHVRIYTHPRDYLNEPAMLQKSFDLFAKAEKAVKGDAKLSHRVAVAKMPLLYTKIVLGQGGYKLEGTALVPQDTVKTELAEEFAKTVAAEKVTHYREGRADIVQWLDTQKKGREKIDIVTLKNDFISLDILPSAGGRIWRATALKAKRQLLRVVENANKEISPWDGGYEEYASDQHRGPGWSETYRVISKTDTSIEMEATLNNGLVMSRKIELTPGKAEFKVTSSVKNPKGAGKITFRVHPEFMVSSTANAKLSMRQRNGQAFIKALANPEAPQAEKELWLREEDKPNGEWTIIDEKTGIRIVNRFNPAEVQFCYCNWNGAQSRVNLEEWRTPVDAKANEAVTLTNTYEIVMP